MLSSGGVEENMLEKTGEEVVKWEAGEVLSTCLQVLLPGSKHSPDFYNWRTYGAQFEVCSWWASQRLEPVPAPWLTRACSAQTPASRTNRRGFPSSRPPTNINLIRAKWLCEPVDPNELRLFPQHQYSLKLFSPDGTCSCPRGTLGR